MLRARPLDNLPSFVVGGWKPRRMMLAAACGDVVRCLAVPTTLIAHSARASYSSC